MARWRVLCVWVCVGVRGCTVLRHSLITHIRSYKYEEIENPLTPHPQTWEVNLNMCEQQEENYKVKQEADDDQRK